MGFSPWEMLEDPGFWFSRLHPDDAPQVAAEMAPLIERGGGNLEYRFRNRAGNYIWIQDTFRVIRGEGGRPLICFTSVPPEIEVFLDELLAHAAEAQPKSPVRKTPKRRRSPLRKNGRALPSGPAVS